MGGCIARLYLTDGTDSVSSLHGRVYRCGQRSVLYVVLFPPYMGGCIECRYSKDYHYSVSSLHGRVYRTAVKGDSDGICFLPTWEGVSGRETPVSIGVMFPPYMGGCIVRPDRTHLIYLVSSLHGRVYRNKLKNLAVVLAFPPYMGGGIGKLNNQKPP